VVRPRYVNPRLSSYQEPVGHGEVDDPLHFAPSLVELVRRTPRQEIGTHTFSHYFCLEAGQDRAAFDADLASATAVAREYGIQIRSIVFPFNQFNAAYRDLLDKHGITCYRGSRPSWIYRESAKRQDTLPRRAARLADSYVNLSGPLVVDWSEVREPDGLCNVAWTCFLRPYAPARRRFDSLRLLRITESLRKAAADGGIFHLWWHPHNFGLHLEENLRFLRTILEAFAACRSRYGMRSLSMAEVAAHATGTAS
jgi:hypothetical protein